MKPEQVSTPNSEGQHWKTPRPQVLYLTKNIYKDTQAQSLKHRKTPLILVVAAFFDFCVQLKEKAFNLWESLYHHGVGFR